MREVCVVTKEKGILIMLLEWRIYATENEHEELERAECDGKRTVIAT